MTGQTVILGTTYAGRPMVGSFALRLWLREREEGAASARRLLAAHKVLCRCGKDEHNFADDMTPVPMEGLVRCAADSEIAAKVEADLRFTMELQSKARAA